MKQNLFNKLWLRVGMIVAIMTTALSGTAWAEGSGSYTVSFKSTTTSNDGTQAKTALTDIVSAGTDYVASISDADKVYQGKSGYGVKLGSSSVVGKFTMNLSDAGKVTATSISFNSCKYGSDNSSLKITINGSLTQTFALSAALEDYTYTFTSPTEISTITVEGVTKRIYVKEMTVNYGGVVTPTCAAPTFSPAAGTYTSAQNVTLSTETAGATIYYTTNGVDPTTSSSVYSTPISVSSTTTIKAIATAAGYDNSSVATAKYVFTTHAGTEEDPYTVAEARALIDAGVGLENKYATGIVSQIVTPWGDGGYQNITFNLVDEEGDEDFLQAFRCVGTDAPNVQVNDIAVVSGNLTKHNSTYEFAQGCTLISLTHTSSQQNADLSFSPTTAEADLANLSAFTAPTLSNPYSLAVTYVSSNESVATVAADGTLTILAKGTTTITASSEETPEYFAGTASYTLTVTNSNVTLVTVDGDGNTTFDFTDNGWGFPTTKQIEEDSFTNSGYTVKVAGSTGNGFNCSESNSVLIMGKSGAYLTLPAFDYDVEKIEVVGGGSNASSNVVQNIFVGDDAVSTATTGAASVTHTYIIDELYKAAGTIYTLKVTNAYNTQVSSIKVYKAIPDTRDEAEIAFSAETLTITQGESYTAPTFSNPHDVAVTFTTTNGSVASWNNGLVLGGSTGSTTITATFDGDVNYKPATATLVVTINEDLGFATVKVGSGVYQKITSTSELEAGKRYLIVYWDGTSDDAEVFGGVISSNIGDRVTLSIAENKINNNVADAATPVVLQDDGLGNWYIMDGDEFLYWTSGNNLYSSSDVNQNGNTWSIDVDKITNATTTGRRLQYNTGSPRFACYTGSQKDVVLYKELPVTLNSEGYATFASTSAVDFSDDSEFSAWKISSVSGTSINFEQITGTVAAGTGVLLKGTANAELTFVKADSGTNISSTNKLVGFPTGGTIAADAYYGLKGTTFVKVNAGTVKAGKALLPASVVNGTEVKALTFVFEDDATGISLMEDGRSQMEDGVIYNVAGQRISKMQKGINIVNGKKIAVK